MFRVRLAHNDDQVRDLAVGDPCLGSIDPVPVAVFLCGRTDRLEIGACIWLTHCNGGDKLAGRQFRNPATLLLFRAVIDDIRHDDGVVEAGSKSAHAFVVLLLDDHDIMTEVTAMAAELSGCRNTQ